MVLLFRRHPPQLENHMFSHPKPPPKPETPSKSTGLFPNSPHSSGLDLIGQIDPRQILSSSRVSFIDSNHPIVDSLLEIVVLIANGSLRSSSSSADNSVKEEDDSFGIFDVRLNLKGKSRGSLVLELNLEALSTSRSVFMDLIIDCRKSVTGSAANLCRIEVPEVENLNLFRDAIKLIFDDDIPKRLLKIGVYRSIDILEIIWCVEIEFPPHLGFILNVSWLFDYFNLKSGGGWCRQGNGKELEF
ncbi:hypothetical protein CsSME_00013529 [Camellia sinensis var. sinensis]